MRLKLSLVALACAATASFAVQAEDLLDIYKEAYLRDPVVLQAKAARDQAFAAIDEKQAALLPQIDVVGSLGYAHTNVTNYGVRGDNTQSSIGVSLSQSLWRHSSWINKTIAEKQAAAADLAYNDALQNLIIRVSYAYFDVLNAADSLEFQKANTTALKRQLDEAVRQFQVGLIAETDRMEAQAAYDLSNAKLIAAENNLTNSYEAMRVLIGRIIPVSDLDRLDNGRFSTPAVSGSLKALIKQAEENNLALQQAIVDRDIAKDQISLAQTGHEPTLDLVASAQTGYTDYRHEVANTTLMDGNAWTQSIGINLNVPIYHGGAVSSQVEQAEHNYVAKSEALELAHRKVVSNVNNGYNNVNAAISSVRAYNQSVKSASSALEATRAGYEVGTRTMTDVLDATQNLYNALQLAADSRYKYIESRLDLLYYQGKLKIEDIEQVNTGLKKK
jgi:outer membrane protein